MHGIAFSYCLLSGLLNFTCRRKPNDDHVQYMFLLLLYFFYLFFVARVSFSFLSFSKYFSKFSNFSVKILAFWFPLIFHFFKGFFWWGCFLIFLSFPNISQLFLVFQVFLFSKNRLSGPIFSVSQNVHMFVFLSVCLSVRYTFSLCLTVFLPPLPEVQCPNFLNFGIPGEK